MLKYQLIRFIMSTITVYQGVLVVYALMSWFPKARESALGDLVNRLARPYISFFDRFIPPIGGISFNVIIALFVLQLLERLIIRLLI